MILYNDVYCGDGFGIDSVYCYVIWHCDFP